MKQKQPSPEKKTNQNLFQKLNLFLNTKYGRYALLLSSALGIGLLNFALFLHTKTPKELQNFQIIRKNNQLYWISEQPKPKQGLFGVWPKETVQQIRKITLVYWTILCILLYLYTKSQGQKILLLEWAQKHPLAIATLIFLLPFAITRLTPLLYYFKPKFFPDSHTYIAIWKQMEKGTWPTLAFRPPGYPTFLWAIFQLWPSWKAVVIAQMILSMLSCLFLIYTIYKLYPQLTIPAAIAMAAFSCSNTYLLYDLSILTESLTASTYLLALALLIKALYTKKHRYFLLTSLLLAYATLLRPAALSWGAVLALTAFYLYKNQYGLASILSLWIPFTLTYIGLCLYNLLTFGLFAFSLMGNLAIFGATATYATPRPEFPNKINQVIHKVHRSISEKERQILQHSWNREKFQSLYQKYFGYAIYQTNLLPIRNLALYGELKKVAALAILEHPQLYCKTILTTNLTFLFHNIKRKTYLFYQMEFLSKPSFLERAFTLHEWINSFLFRTSLWPILAILIFLFALLRWIKSSFQDKEAFLLILLGSIALSASLLVSLVSMPLLRYSYLVEFTYYLTVALSPLLLWNKINQKEKENQKEPSPPTSD
ncbi:MAG: hypothetical protein D6805_07700 [Planctomycetota bacterium]|nr:MAG: hypothetical protein D6805_07700 [Planctomycetota bacterium]